MWIAGERKVNKITETFGTPFSGDGIRTHIAAQNLRDFNR